MEQVAILIMVGLMLIEGALFLFMHTEMTKRTNELKRLSDELCMFYDYIDDIVEDDEIPISIKERLLSIVEQLPKLES
jgi:hypothetical protein